MKFLIPLVSFLAVAFLQIGGCASDGKPTGDVNVSATNPTDVQVTVGGTIHFAKRPLTPEEKQQTHDIAYAAGYAYGSGLLPNQLGDEAKFKYNMARRLAYRFRVALPVVKGRAYEAYDEGRNKAAQSTPAAP